MRFFHHGVVGKKGGTTVGYEWVDKESGKMLVTFARCSDHPDSTDVFDKTKARLICEGRLKKGIKFKAVEKPKDMDRYEFLIGLILENDKETKARYGTHKRAA
jgi:hypothetical protein